MRTNHEPKLSFGDDGEDVYGNGDYGDDADGDDDDSDDGGNAGGGYGDADERVRG